MKKRSLLQRAIIIGIVTVVGFYIVLGPHGRRPHLPLRGLGDGVQSLQHSPRFLRREGGV